MTQIKIKWGLKNF